MTTITNINTNTTIKSASNVTKEEKNMKKNNTTKSVNATTVNYTNITKAKEENAMENTTINITNNFIEKNTVELLRAAEEAGINFDKINMNDSPLGIAMSGDGPREAGIAFMQLVANNYSNPREAAPAFQQLLMLGAAMKEQGIVAKDSIEDEIDSVPVIINYRNCKIYMGLNGSLKELANLDDLNCALPEEAVQTLLKERASHVIADMRKHDQEARNYYEDYDYEDDEEDEYWD